MCDVVDSHEKTQHLLATIIYLQHTDNSYDSVNFDDPVSTLSYFTKLYYSLFSKSSEEDVDRMYNSLMGIFEINTKKGSTKSGGVQAQHIMRKAAEKIHGALQESNLDSLLIGDTIILAYDTFRDAICSLAELVVDYHGDDGDANYLSVDSRSF